MTKKAKMFEDPAAESQDEAASDDATKSPDAEPQFDPAPPASSPEPEPEPEAATVLVIPLDNGSYVNGVPHIPQFAEAEQAESLVASGAFRYGDADDKAALDAEAAFEAAQSEGDADQA
ncbi:MAG: hypothetical protein EPN91_00035 [Salinibacterium sp.]|nr:MAG: hypothetical protein EPN91_00035 [Salinibacterium sp.]